jgi:hypothetical protein
MIRDGQLALPWLLVVARGQRQLIAELQALFRADARVRVIEDRRDARNLLPRAGAVSPTALPPPRP